MDAPSPLKSWVRNHSPFRHRDKPLPPVPADQSPARHPIQPVSGNVSPPKSNKKTSVVNSDAAPAPRTNRFLALLKPKAQSQTHPLPPQLPDSPGADLDTHRSPVQAGSTRSLFRSARSRTPDLRNLSRKVSNLEAELKAARRELDAVLGTPRVDSVGGSPEHQPVERPQLQARTASDEFNSQIIQRAESLSQRGRFDGLVENLLGQPQGHSLRSNTIDTDTRPVTRHGPTPSSDLKSYMEAEDAYEPVEVHVARPAIQDPPTKQLKRKHTEPQADARWQEMQERVREFEASKSKQTQQEEQPKEQGSQQEFKEMPEAKRVRWSEDDVVVEYTQEDEDEDIEHMKQSTHQRNSSQSRSTRSSQRRIVSLGDELLTSSSEADIMDLDDAATLTALPQCTPPPKLRVLRTTLRDNSIKIRRVSTPGHKVSNTANENPSFHNAESTTITPVTSQLKLIEADSPATPSGNAFALAVAGSGGVSKKTPRSAGSGHISPSPSSSPAPSPSANQKQKQKSKRVRKHARAPSITGLAALSSNRLSRVVEEFEWDDGEVF